MTPFNGFPEDLFHFLEDLAANNDRHWFNANKERYRASVVTPVGAFISAMGERLPDTSPHFRADPRQNGGSMFRIYRDTRFSRDKRPYKENAACHFRHFGMRDAHSPGFYLHLEPGKVFAGAGIWKPPAGELDSLRTSIAEHPEQWQKILRGRRFARRFGKLQGEALKRPPRGYAADHPCIEDLKHKSFFVKCPLDESLALEPGFVDEVSSAYGDSVPLMKFIATALKLPF